MKCEKCGFVSFEHNLICPSCKKDLGTVRSKLGIHYMAPEVVLEDFFLGGAGGPTASDSTAAKAEPELDLNVGEEFEFTLDD